MHHDTSPSQILAAKRAQDMTLRDYAQGAYRMRGIGRGWGWLGKKDLMALLYAELVYL